MKLTPLQIETLRLVRDGKVAQRNYGHGAWRIVGANPSVVGRMTSLGLVRWTKVIGGEAALTFAGIAALNTKESPARRGASLSGARETQEATKSSTVEATGTPKTWGEWEREKQNEEGP